MPLPSAAQFANLLLSRPLEEVVQAHVFDGEVFAFRGAPTALDVLQGRLAGALAVRAQDVRVVGSAKIGFSLDPNAFPRQFSDSSDVDVAVVSADLFDAAWNTVLDWHYLRRHNLPAPEFAWVKARKDDFYWGYLVPSQLHFAGLLFPAVLRPLRDLSTRWFNAFRELGSEPLLATRTVSGRLYRTWNHALRYHVHGLERIRRDLSRRQRQQ
jgi:hypothetical protein